MTDDAPSERPPDAPDSLEETPDGVRERLAWVRRTDHAAVALWREAASTALVVALVGLVLFGASGVWPPMVAVESGSMEPHLERGDLVFVMEESRFAPEFATGDTGVVTYRVGEERGFRNSGDYGDVIVFQRDGRDGTVPVIHRARFWVNDSENWYDEANPEHLAGDSCAEVRNCPAPNAGFVTLGDDNRYYDQATGLSRPVRPSWIRGTAAVDVPFLGHVRLAVAGR